ncbi:MAG: hypothetical protein DRO01_02680 [Thermoproteota archaeon]|nr:MAG: hypothetical protein DRO01_02680 [Candidatus Korarchaeota archaeon]
MRGINLYHTDLYPHLPDGQPRRISVRRIGPEIVTIRARVVARGFSEDGGEWIAASGVQAGHLVAWPFPLRANWPEIRHVFAAEAAVPVLELRPAVAVAITRTRRGFPALWCGKFLDGALWTIAPERRKRKVFARELDGARVLLRLHHGDLVGWERGEDRKRAAGRVVAITPDRAYLLPLDPATVPPVL